MKYQLFLTVISISIFLSGCDSTVQTANNAGRILPNVTGASGEVLVVMDKYLWEGNAGEIIQDILKKEFPALPQSEPLFDVTQITSASFDNIFKFHRSVVLVTLKEGIEESEVKFKKNVWARPQIVVQVDAKSSKDLVELLDRNKNRIQQFLVQYDRQRLTDSYSSSRDLEIQKKMAENHHIRLAIPRGYNIDFFSNDYSSVSIEAPDFSQVLHVFEYPATEADLKSDRLFEKRNEYVKKYVKGPGDNSYMTTSTVYPPIFYDIQSNSTSMVEMRGLWELEGGYMGGPFINHSVFDPKRNRIVTVEGYVYFPNQKKRVKIRQLEAIIYSLEIL